jgi:hypothetical protein
MWFPKNHLFEICPRTQCVQQRVQQQCCCSMCIRCDSKRNHLFRDLPIVYNSNVYMGWNNRTNFLEMWFDCRTALTRDWACDPTVIILLTSFSSARCPPPDGLPRELLRVGAPPPDGLPPTASPRPTLPVAHGWGGATAASPPPSPYRPQPPLSHRGSISSKTLNPNSTLSTTCPRCHYPTAAPRRHAPPAARLQLCCNLLLCLHHRRVRAHPTPW